MTPTEHAAVWLDGSKAMAELGIESERAGAVQNAIFLTNLAVFAQKMAAAYQREAVRQNEKAPNDPRITDNDAGSITATIGDKEIRGWSYRDDAERRIKMLMAHEFAEGWYRSGKPK